MERTFGNQRISTGCLSGGFAPPAGGLRETPSAKALGTHVFPCLGQFISKQFKNSGFPAIAGICNKKPIRDAQQSSHSRRLPSTCPSARRHEATSSAFANSKHLVREPVTVSNKRCLRRIRGHHDASRCIIMPVDHFNIVAHGRIIGASRLINVASWRISMHPRYHLFYTLFVFSNLVCDNPIFGFAFDLQRRDSCSA